MSQILLVEDDESLGRLVSDYLSSSGYSVEWLTDGLKVRSFSPFENLDIILLDVMLPGIDGFTLLKEIRDINSQIPILMITARSLLDDRLAGFSYGADDYITKPFSLKELAYRVQVFIRRSQKSNVTPKIHKIGSYTFDEANLLLQNGAKTFALTQRESDLLSLLLKNSNRLLKREEILVKLWGENDYFKGRSLDVFISRLRKYFHLDSRIEIRNHHGVGFVFISGN